MSSPRQATARARPSSKRAPRARPPKSSKVRATPEAVVVGDKKKSVGVQRALARLELAVHWEPTVSQLRDEASSKTRAVVLVPPLQEGSVDAAVDAVRETAALGAALLFVVVEESFTDKQARSLYRRGVAAVVEWPSEAIVLPRMLSELLSIPPRNLSGKGNAALARSVKARLRLADEIGDGVEVSVVDGTATLSGTIDSFWKKQRVEQMLIHVPGVNTVLSDQLGVVTPTRSDDALVADVRSVLYAAAHTDPSTISVAASDGMVTLAGSVESRTELDRLLHIVGNVRGIRSIQNLATVSAPATKRARGTAGRIEKLVAQLDGAEDVQVSVFDDVAVLVGTVDLLLHKRAVVKRVSSQPAIARVVDKLRVRD